MKRNRKSLDITECISQPPSITVPFSNTPMGRLKKGFVRSRPCAASMQSENISIKARDFEIEGFPVGLWDSESFIKDNILSSDRITELLRKFELGHNFYIMMNPFSHIRSHLWLRKNAQINALNGAFNFRTVDTKNKLELQSFPECFYAKLTEGVFFFEFLEEFLGNSAGTRSYIIFRKELHGGRQWPSSEIKNFLKNFSKELYDLWNKENKSIGDPSAFDSLFLPDKVIKDFRADFEDFLHSRKMYIEDLKLPWKRGYMLIGPPGNGKTLLIRSVCQYYGLEYFDIKRVIDNGGNLNMDSAMESSIDAILYPDEERPKVCILEDIDKFTAFQSGGNNDQDYGSISLHSLLRGLDGVDSYSDIILMATSNFPDVLHEAIAGRPGRFDKIYAIEKPTEENIQKLLAHYRLTFDGCNSDFVSKSLLGSSMAFVAEFVKMAKMKYKRNNITVEEANLLLEGIKSHQKLCETHFKEDKKVGFKK